MISFLKEKKFFVIGGLALVAIAFVVFGGGSSDGSDTTQVTFGDLVRTVHVSGKVIPNQSADLSFERGGTVSRVVKKSGDAVYAGEVIVELDQSSTRASYLKAQADLEAARAELAKVSGTGDTQTKTENATRKIVQEIVDSYTQADDAIHNKIDQFFDDPRSANPEINFAFDDYDLRDSINVDRVVMEDLLKTWKASVSKLTLETYSLQYFNEAKAHLSTILSFLNDIARAVNSFEANQSLTQTTIDKYKTDVSTARSNINAAMSALITVGDTLRESVSDVPVQKARVLSAEATVASYRADLDKMVLRAPFSGIVSKQDAEVGEAVSANTKIVSVISNDYQIEAFIPEVSVAGVSIGNIAQVKLDAYTARDTFVARITHLDPAETIKDGVSTYKVNLVFDAPDSRIKSGMTTNIEIETQRKSEVILVPKRAVVEENDMSFVYVVSGDSKNQEKRTIEIGLSDSEGNVEVLSGLVSGESVLINPPKK